jgi:protein subunit release factor B
MSKELLFSVTAGDCRWDYYRGTGAGGQKRNKTESAVRCTHIASGAVGQAEDTRSQHQNKQLAFKRMGESKKFQAWARLEAMRATGKLKQIEEKIEFEMAHRTKVEIQEDGKWVDENNTNNVQAD